MKKQLILTSSIIIGLFLILQSTQGHVPVAGEPGDTLESAFEIKDPLKSWVLYHDIHEPREAHYYKFQMEAEDRLRLVLNLPIELKSSDFRPILILTGPGLINSTPAPDYLEIPTGSGYVMYDVHTPHLEYEGFTPSAFLKILDIDTTIPETGVYYLAIYSSLEAERYALAIGFQEVFTLEEWIFVPLDVISIHQWEGQNLFFILSPWIVTLGVGIIYYSKRGEDLGIERDPLTWIGISSGLLFIGSAFALIFQMVWALLQVPPNILIFATIIFTIIPAILGITTLRTIRSGWNNNINNTLKLALISGIAIVTWAGLIIGPFFLFLFSLIGIFNQKQRKLNQP
jgi:hypothetical protein